MGYKYKPNKSVAKRFKVTKTGKVKHHHSFTSHLMSARPANSRRKMRQRRRAARRARPQHAALHGRLQVEAQQNRP